MKTTVYIGPPVWHRATNGKVPPHADHSATTDSSTPRSFLAGLAPLRLLQTSQTLFGVEIAVVALVAGLLLAVLMGDSNGRLPLHFALVAMLGGTLLVGYTGTRRRQAAAAVVDSPAPRMDWAYRVTNYRQLRESGIARLLPRSAEVLEKSPGLRIDAIAADQLQPGDIVLVESGQTIPADGQIVEGFAIVDESPITGQSALVVRDDRDEKHVMRASRVIAGQVFIEVSARRGHPLDWIGGGESMCDAGRACGRVLSPE